MKVLILGATGMVGQGVLRESLRDSAVESVTVLVRRPTGESNAKLREIVHSDLLNLAPVADQLAGLDACFYCLGVSSVGLDEARYTQVTFDITMSVANTLLAKSPGLTFIFVSGAGTDSSEKGRSMWARVKGRAENALFAMPFKAVYAFRPGLIIPLHGIRSRTAIYNVAYTFIRPLVPLIRRAFHDSVTTTEQIGQAMLEVTKHGFPKRILEASDIVVAGNMATLRASGAVFSAARSPDTPTSSS
jgi:uncharacterized protein YbjT (DUF2867 family)